MSYYFKCDLTQEYLLQPELLPGWASNESVLGIQEVIQVMKPSGCNIIHISDSGPYMGQTNEMIHRKSRNFPEFLGQGVLASTLCNNANRFGNNSDLK